MKDEDLDLESKKTKELEEFEEEDGEDDVEKEELKEFKKLENKKINTLNFKATANKKNMYFDEARVVDLIINHYQPSLKYDENGKIIARDSEAEEEILANLLLVAKAIINKYSYWRFCSNEDLESECLKECWKYLPKFTTEKGTAFNLFSIICKMHLLNYTLKLKKYRLTADIDIHPEVQAEDETRYSLFFEALEGQFLKTINEHYLKEKRIKYIQLSSILMEYLVKNRMVVGKNDLISSFREYGFKSSDYKDFIKEMSKYKLGFYDLAE
jgi:hypothetical protein